MKQIDRRHLLQGALLGAAAATQGRAGADALSVFETVDRPCEVIDTNVNLFQWPFRRLPYDDVSSFVAKLRSLQISQAWAGSFEAVLHRDVSGTNERLAEACRQTPGQLLVPFGSVNPTLPDWEEDLRRCRQRWQMPGIRLYPNYHGYTLDDPRCGKLFALAAENELLVQIAAAMEDTRTQHFLLQVPEVDLSPLPPLMKQHPGLRVQILNYRPRGELAQRLMATPRIYLDIARVESTDGINKLLVTPARDRIVFGTHAPFLIYEAALIKVYESALTPGQTKAVLEENATQMLAARPA